MKRVFVDEIRFGNTEKIGCHEYLNFLKNIEKAVRLPLFSNRPDVRLLNNRIRLPLLRSRGQGHYEAKQIFENVKMISDGKEKFIQDPHYRAKAQLARVRAN